MEDEWKLVRPEESKSIDPLGIIGKKFRTNFEFNKGNFRIIKSYNINSDAYTYECGIFNKTANINDWINTGQYVLSED